MDLDDYFDYAPPTDLLDDFSFENYDYFLNMDYLDTMKMSLHDQNFNLAKQAPWQVKIGTDDSTIHCDGSFVNRQFIVAARHCIEQLNQAKLRVFNLDHCDAKMSVAKIQHLQFVTVIQVANASLKNFPICLPSNMTFQDGNYLRIFSTDNDCLVKDAFLKINSTISEKMNCSHFEICGYSPDSYLCDWMQRGAILTKSEAGQVSILGISGRFSQCQNNWFRFWNLSHSTILSQLAKIIKSGDCPRWIYS